jgi:FixJ family two-component response regulator
VLDVSLPDLNGLDLQERIATDRIDMPIIFITGHGDVPMTVRAMKRGARSSSPSRSATMCC